MIVNSISSRKSSNTSKVINQIKKYIKGFHYAKEN